MKTGGGIGLIAIGVALLSLAYTGRAQAVWSALTSGDAPASDAPPEQPDGADIDPEPMPTQQAGDNPARTHPQAVPYLRVMDGGRLAHGRAG